MSAPELTEAEAAVVARFDAAAEPAEVTRAKLRLAEEAIGRVRAHADTMDLLGYFGDANAIRTALDGA